MHLSKTKQKRLIVLAGGRGSRIGINKALTPLSGTPMILYVVTRGLQVAEKVAVVIGRDDAVAAFRKVLPKNVTVLRDSISRRSPLVGMLTGLENLVGAVKYSAVVPCDSPFIRPKVLQRLFQVAEGHDAAIPIWPNGYVEPLHSVYEVQNTIRAIRLALKTERSSNRDMIKHLKNVKYVPVEELRSYDPELRTFFNVNRPEDLREASKILDLERADPSV
jgi:molybdopterin-guanine dinucleotide biosynthesis protein A